MIGREVLLSHSKAVATLGVQVQFSGFVSLRPLLVQSNTLRRESELIISRSRNKHGRRIRGNRGIFELFPARIDRGYEGGPAFRQIMKGNSGSHRPPRGESDKSAPVRENSPFCCVLPNVGDSR